MRKVLMCILDGCGLGNKNKVHAIKFVAAGTIEERIIDLLEIKQIN